MLFYGAYVGKVVGKVTIYKYGERAFISNFGKRRNKVYDIW